MEKERMIRQLLEKGFLVSPEYLEKANEHTLAELRPQESLFAGAEAQPLMVQKRKYKQKTNMTTNDYSQYYRDRYESIKAMLMKKISNPMSLNKIKNEYSEISVIVMVREKTPRGFVGEDMTGEVEVMIQQDVEPDDVIGVNGVYREGRIIGNTITYPDVPFNRKINTADAEVMLSDIQKDGAITPDMNPQYIEITSGKSRANILAYKPRTSEKSHVLGMLKRRHLSPEIGDISTDKDMYVIDPIPEVFWIISDNNWSQIYKGILIISCRSAKVNMKTKEFEFIK